jgi:hypothetical protein
MRNWTKRTKLLFLVLVALPGFLLFVALGGVVVRELWNALLPPLFGLPAVTFWQALGLLALSRILFGGFGLNGGSGSHYRRRWEAMTPEERERVRQRLRGRWGSAPPASESQGQ